MTDFDVISKTNAPRASGINVGTFSEYREVKGKRYTHISLICTKRASYKTEETPNGRFHIRDGLFE